MNKLLHLLPYEGNYQYCEATQSSEVRFSVAVKTKEGFKQEYYPFKCRDFFTELLLGKYLNKIIPKVYGFLATEVWDGKYITIESSDEKEYEGIAKHFHLLRKLEKEVLGIGHRNYTKLYTTDSERIYVVKLNKIWSYSPVLLSFVTLLLRGFASFNKWKEQEELQSLDDMFNAFVTSTGTDKHIYSELVGKTFDYLRFLSNYQKVLVEPITGFYDKGLVDLNLESANVFNVEVPNRSAVTWTKMQSHDYSGIYSLAYAVNKGYALGCVGREWVKGYNSLNEK